MPLSAERKAEYFDKMKELLTTYSKCFIVQIDNVGSMQLQQTRLSLRGTAEVLMGKNTMMRKCIREYVEENPDSPVAQLEDECRGNVGFVFTNGDLGDIREVLEIVKKRTGIKVTDEAMKKSKKCEFSNSMTAMEYLFWIEKRYIDWCESGKSGEFNPRTGVDGPTIDYAKNDSKDRLWNYKDRKVIANKHMKIGVEWNQKKTLRIYFEIIDDELVVFYAGRHP